MRGAGPLALALLVVVSGLAAVATPAAAADDAFVAVDVQATPDPAAPGTNVTVTTTVDNIYDDGSPYKLQRVALRETEAGNGTEYDSRTPSTIVHRGTSASVNLSEEFERTGEFERYVHVKLISGGGRVVSLVRPVTVSVQQSHPAMSLTTAGANRAGRTDFGLTVANGLPDTVRGVSVDVESDDVSFAENQRVVSSLESGQQAEVTFPTQNATTGRKSVEATLSYLTADGESRSVTRTLSTTVDDSGTPAQIELTGRRVTTSGDEVVVRGSASNVGSTNASSVKIAVGNGEAVRPAQNQASYFVGNVQASDYSSFEVHGVLTDDVNGSATVPVEVSYTVDDERVTRTVDVGFTAGSEPAVESTRQSSSSPVVPVVGVLVVLVVGGLAWRRFG